MELPRSRRDYWWYQGETVPGLLSAVTTQERFICTPRVAKHRLFVWAVRHTLPDSRVYAIACEDDYFLGVLHSHARSVGVGIIVPTRGLK